MHFKQRDDENVVVLGDLAGRRAVLEQFRRMLDDDAYFDSLIEANKGKEAVWQQFFETNPWVLGVGLGTQLFTSWSEEKLEQIVKGHSIAGDGKRADALLRTSGTVHGFRGDKAPSDAVIEEGVPP